jgi:hypothetical protein
MKKLDAHVRHWPRAGNYKVSIGIFTPRNSRPLRHPPSIGSDASAPSSFLARVHHQVTCRKRNYAVVFVGIFATRNSSALRHPQQRIGSVSSIKDFNSHSTCSPNQRQRANHKIAPRFYGNLHAVKFQRRHSSIAQPDRNQLHPDPLFRIGRRHFSPLALAHQKQRKDSHSVRPTPQDRRPADDSRRSRSIT